MVGDSGDFDFSSSALRERGIKFLGFGWESESVCVSVEKGGSALGITEQNMGNRFLTSLFSSFFNSPFTVFFYIYKMSFKFSQN
jgi:hypothetical protein